MNSNVCCASVRLHACVYKRETKIENVREREREEERERERERERMDR